MPRKKSTPAPSVKDVHHLVFMKKHWRQGYAKAIRRFHYCKQEIPKNTLHKFIHSKMSGIPCPNDAAAKYAYEQLISLERCGFLNDRDRIEDKLRLLIALFSELAPATADGFREQLRIVREFYNKKAPP